MQVIKRDGTKETVNFSKITARIKKLVYELDKSIDANKVAQKVIEGVKDGITTTEIDNLAAEQCAMMATIHPDYSTLASRIAITNLHKNTYKHFSTVMKHLYEYKDSNGQSASLISDETYRIIERNSHQLDSAIIYDRDFNLDYFGFKTLEKSYLLKINGKVAERPQHMFMRVAVGIHGKDIEAVLETYNLLSEGWFTHATPTLFNAGTRHQQLSSCFVENTEICTVNEGIKKIKDVKIGDLIVTHKGTVEKVVQLHKNLLNNRQLFDVKCFKTPNITVTDNHRFWSITNEQLEWKEFPQWNSIEKLRVGDYIAIPKMSRGKKNYSLDLASLKDIFPKNNLGNIEYEYFIDDNKIHIKSKWIRKHKLNKNDKEILITKNHQSINRFIKIDKNFAKFLGIWYGDGCVYGTRTTNRKHNMNSIISIVSHKNNKKLIDFCFFYMTKTFGINIRKSIYENGQNPNCLYLSLDSMLLATIFVHLFGKGYANKKLFKDIYSWDKELILSLLEGLISSDGCVTSKNLINIQMSNKTFVKSIYHVCRQNNIDVSYQNKGNKNSWISVPNNLKLDILKYYKDNRLNNFKNNFLNQVKIIDGMTFVRINKKTKNNNKPKYVYTLGIEKSHSYSVEGLIAENCFLISMKNDSISGIYDTLKTCAEISKYAGGIGLHVHNIRANGAYIRGTNGTSNGLVPMLKVFNETARYVDQGGNRRKGSIAVYLEPWHSDIIEFLDLKKPNGKEELRARDLFLALWIPDLFMERVEKDEYWHLMCPDECKGLSDVYGEEFNKLYLSYVAQGKYRKVVKARDIWDKIISSQLETGTPYMLYKDSVNLKSNQKNLGTIKSSNLCCEVTEYTSPDEVAVCNLASIALPKFVIDGKFDHQRLFEVTQVITKNLNKVIDINFYPVKEAEYSNKKHRPIGIGVQGLADVFFKLHIPFDSDEARKLNKEIFETIYFGALTASKDLAKKDGVYDSYKGSPASQGILQYDMWGVIPSNRWDWNKLKESIKKHGLRNSLLLAPMPTASTSQILGNTECFEPITSNLYTRRVLSGEFIVVNKYLLKDLIELKLWNDSMRQSLIANDGSVQNLNIPENLKTIYRTVWEIPQRSLIDMSADRGAFICQSQSLNLFVDNPTYAKLTSMHFYAWQKGLKTGVYYTRIKAARNPIKFTLNNTTENLSCKINDPDCMTCSS